MSVHKSRLVDLPRITDGRGDLSFAESHNQIPFCIRRIYYLYNIPGGEERGHHGHKVLEQLIIPIHGAFDVTLDDGTDRIEYHLDKQNVGLYVPPGMWRELTNFSDEAVCLVLASELYDENDYFRDYNDFVEYKKGRLL